MIDSYSFSFFDYDSIAYVKNRMGKETDEQMNEESKKDVVNHPEHYEGSCSIECIEMMEAMFGKDSVIEYCCMNAFKYLWRYKFKNGLEDINKAKWYINKADELLNGRENFDLVGVKVIYDIIIAKINKKEGKNG